MLPRTALLLLSGVALHCQTTQGVIAGRVTNSGSSAAVAGARIHFYSVFSPSKDITTNPAGYYAAVGLPPGRYRIRVEAPGYQSLEVQQLELAVAGRIELNFTIRLLTEVWESGQYRSLTAPQGGSLVTFFGPDLDEARPRRLVVNKGAPGALEATISDVIDPAQLRELPLNSRDAYSLIVTQPGVTSDSSTSFGLGVSVNGQRPSSSNFLLDGVENNNPLVTGPASVIAPEAIQEYRISTNSFSAEFGRTTGFVANAVTRTGGAAWHGLGYFNFQNDALNANSFQRNSRGFDRNPFKGAQSGGQAGGPLARNRVFASAAFDWLRTRSFQDEMEVYLPSTAMQANTTPESLARGLLTQYPASITPNSVNLSAPVTVRPSSSVNRWIGLTRLDAVAGRHRVSTRYAAFSLENPDFSWTPYPDFVSGLDQSTHSLMGRIDSMLTSTRMNEFRFAWSRTNLGWDRAHPEIPTLIESRTQAILPGSPMLYAYRNRGNNFEVGDSITIVQAAHIPKFGGGFFWFRPSGALTAGRDGFYQFQDMLDFTIDDPTTIFAPLDRARLPQYVEPDFDRDWRQRQFYLFAQDTWRLTPRLVLNYGLRYDSFGAPTTSGDTLLRLGSGESFSERIATATLERVSDGGLWSADRNDFQGRMGVSFSPRAGGSLVLRAAYGIFQDHPYDNLWQNIRNNSLVLAHLLLSSAGGYNYLAPVNQQLSALRGTPYPAGFPTITAVDPHLHNGYSQTFFGGAQWRTRPSLFIEVNGTGTLGRKLITTDVVNRNSADNPNLAEIAWRSSQGSSRYFGLQGLARWSASYGLVQAAYTWSHAIDNQSDPLAGDYFDLRFTRPGQALSSQTRARFLRPYDSSGDLGNSDFDQRHNFMVFSIWNWKGFRFSQLAAFRSGLPYSVTAGNLRADLVSDPYVSESVAGGKRLLDPAAFRVPAAGTYGNTGRNAFRGPGSFNLDISLARSFRLGESRTITLRADAYNVLNHANLDNPVSLIGSPDFGIATYGRRGRETSFPALTPFVESPRMLQLIFRFEF